LSDEVAPLSNLGTYRVGCREIDGIPIDAPGTWIQAMVRIKDDHFRCDCQETNWFEAESVMFFSESPGRWAITPEEFIADQFMDPKDRDHSNWEIL
jgi:hypothetical protein